MNLIEFGLFGKIGGLIFPSLVVFIALMVVVIAVKLTIDMYVAAVNTSNDEVKA